MYILHCSDGSYYTGSTKDLELRLEQHMEGKGANHTRKRLPVKLLYFEEYQRIDDAYYREKQVQGWNRKKKEALIDGKPELLPDLAIAYRDRSSSDSRPIESKPRPEALEGQFYEDGNSSEPATPFGFECLSQRESLSQRDALESSSNKTKSRHSEPESRPEALEGQPHEDDISSESAPPFGFECLSQRGSLSQRGALASSSDQPQSRPEALEGQPNEAQCSKGQPKSTRNPNE